MADLGRSGRRGGSGDPSSSGPMPTAAADTPTETNSGRPAARRAGLAPSQVLVAARRGRERERFSDEQRQREGRHSERFTRVRAVLQRNAGARDGETCATAQDADHAVSGNASFSVRRSDAVVRVERVASSHLSKRSDDFSSTSEPTPVPASITARALIRALFAGSRSSDRAFSRSRGLFGLAVFGARGHAPGASEIQQSEYCVDQLNEPFDGVALAPPERHHRET